MDVVADGLPIAYVERNSDMAGDGIDVNGTVGRAANSRVDHDCILKCFAREDLGWREIFLDYLDDADAGEVGHFRSFGESIRALARGERAPENGYQGDYIADLAVRIAD